MIRMASASVLQRMSQRAKQAEEIIAVLKTQIQDLRQSAAESVSKPEESRLRQENQELRKQIENLKVQLMLAEIQNGVKQVPLPAKKSVVQFSEAKLPTETATTTNNVPKPTQEAKPKAEKKEKKASEAAKTPDDAGEPKAKKGKTNKAPAGEERMDVSRLSFKVGKIVQVEKHPDADSLYVEQVDLGEGRNRTVVSGLVKHIPIEQMQDKVAVFMINLKPAKMRGILSEAMIMCASTPEKVEILNPPAGSVIGDVVRARGFSDEPDAMLNPKKKVWETLKPDLRTDSNKVAAYKGAPLEVEGKGQVTAPTLADVQIQ